MISIEALFRVVLLLVVAGVIWWLFSWLIDYVGIPEPFHKIARVVMAVIAVLVCLSILLQLVGITVWRP